MSIKAGRLDDWPAGVGRHVLPQTGSTNAEALRLSRTLSGPAWVMTHRQTAGRGRRGRIWEMPEGNFAASLMLHPTGSAAEVSLYSFVAALALHDALSAVCGPAARLAIKWPNDVLLNGGKVAGILLESTGSGAGVEALAVGIGVNLAAAPPAAVLEPGATPPVAVLAETGHVVAAEDFLDILAPAFARWQDRLTREGFAPLQAAWLSRAARLGDTITARVGTGGTPDTGGAGMGSASRTGRFDGIDETGALILTTPRGREIIPSADVFFPAEA